MQLSKDIYIFSRYITRDSANIISKMGFQRVYLLSNVVIIHVYILCVFFLGSGREQEKV